MQLSTCWPRRSGSIAADPQVELLRSVLARARRTAFYGNGQLSRLREAQDAAAARLPAEHVLRRLPVIRLAEFLGARAKFWNADARGRVFRPEGVAAAGNGWRRREAIEGTAAALLRFPGAARGAHRLLVNTALGEPLLTGPVREWLWSVFELPVFERLRGFDGEVLATECELHQGLHLDSTAGVFEHLDGELVVTSLGARHYPVLRLATGLRGAFDLGLCPCGRPSPRFLSP